MKFSCCFFLLLSIWLLFKFTLFISLFLMHDYFYPLYPFTFSFEFICNNKVSHTVEELFDWKRHQLMISYNIFIIRLEQHHHGHSDVWKEEKKSIGASCYFVFLITHTHTHTHKHASSLCISINVWKETSNWSRRRLTHHDRTHH